VSCSKRATREDRLRRIFSVFDVDGDGVISKEDLELMVRQLAGTSFTCARAPRPACCCSCVSLLLQRPLPALSDEPSSHQCAGSAYRPSAKQVSALLRCPWER
jgi:hypothetical protein